LGNQKQ